MKLDGRAAVKHMMSNKIRGNLPVSHNCRAVQKAKKAAEKKPGKTAAGTPKRWPPAKDVKADVEFIFQTGLDKGEEMTMGKIYAELGGSCPTSPIYQGVLTCLPIQPTNNECSILVSRMRNGQSRMSRELSLCAATKYGMTSEGIKEKKAQIKAIVKNYEAQLEVPADSEPKEVEKAAEAGPQATEIETAEGGLLSVSLSNHAFDTHLLLYWRPFKLCFGLTAQIFLEVHRSHESSVRKNSNWTGCLDQPQTSAWL